MVAYLNSIGRIECDGIEFSSGDVVEVLIEGKWFKTRIEYNGRAYYSIDGLTLVGNIIRIPKDWETV